MKPHQILHRVALVALVVVALMSIVSSFHQQPGVPLEMRLAPLFGAAIWSWLIWKISKRPRQWGLGVGLLFFVMIAFQCYLWNKAIHDPRATELFGNETVWHFLFIYEAPIFVAGVSCLLLRFHYPADSQPVEPQS